MAKVCCIKCKCGKFQAEVNNMRRGTRAICYCKDCQAYAHYLKRADHILNHLGGTEVIAVRPQQIIIKSGKEMLSCMSLTESGSLRWFTSCCLTPICNMSRNIRTVHISLIHTGIERNAINEAFGNNLLHVKRASARELPPENHFMYFLTSAINYSASVIRAYITQSYKSNPLINPDNQQPIANPVVLDVIERNNLMRIVSDNT